jgi:ParB family chromosome partitioning protein
MSKNSVEAYGAAGKTNLLMFEPEALHIELEDESSPVFDPRALEMPDDNFVRNIQAFGVLEPVLVRKNPETGKTEVVAGRRRVLAARIANERLLASGQTPLQVPAIVKRVDGAEAMEIMVIENAVREDESPMGRAKKMRRLMDRGRTEEQLAIAFGCSSSTVKNTLALLEVVPEVRKAVESGKLNATRAYKLSKLPAETQREELRILVEAAGEETSARKRGVKMSAAAGTSRSKNGKDLRARDGYGEEPTHRAPSKKEVRDYLAEVKENGKGANPPDYAWTKCATAILSWVLGEREARPRIPKAEAS